MPVTRVNYHLNGIMHYITNVQVMADGMHGATIFVEMEIGITVPML